jgi:hypothetical protein
MVDTIGFSQKATHNRYTSTAKLAVTKLLKLGFTAQSGVIGFAANLTPVKTARSVERSKPFKRKLLAIAYAFTTVMPAYSGLFVSPAVAQTNQVFCPGNRFTNGNFAQVIPGGNPDARSDQDIDLAVGWEPLWQNTGGSSLADLYSQSQSPSPSWSPPQPANGGNYASMWISNRTTPDPTYREGMFNKLVTPIQANTGTYQFTFKTAALSNPLNAAPTEIGIYGVRRSASAALPPAPTTMTDPSNLALFGASNTVLLGTISVPPAATNQWQNQTMTFDTAAFGGLPEVTHVMVTKMDRATPTYQLRYMAFDDFCMQSQNPPPPSGPISTCCPPMDNKLFGQFFKRIEGNITSPYELKFDPVGLGFSSQYTGLLNAYQAYYNVLNYQTGGAVTDLTIGVYLIDGGNGNLPVASTGTPLNQAFINFSNGPIAQPPANSFFNTALQPNQWYGIKEYTYPNTGFSDPQRAGFAESCNKDVKTWVRWQVINGRMMRQTINDGKLESVELKAVSAK